MWVLSILHHSLPNRRLSRAISILDARRCSSYLTIEHSGPVDVDLRGLMGNRIYGCDDCLAACPWNKFAKEASDIRYHARADLMAPNLGELAMLDDAAFRAKFLGSPIKPLAAIGLCAMCFMRLAIHSGPIWFPLPMV